MTVRPPEVLIFDVNETLSDLTPLRDRFAEIGVAPELFPLWFAGVLRDGFALTAAGAYAEFADLARDGLRALLTERGGPPARSAIDHVLSGFSTLGVHPDVPEGLRALRASGARMVTMTNGSVAATDAVLENAGVRDCFDLLLDVGGPRRWKPDPAAYTYAVEAADVRPEDAMLVAVHPWDVDGALRAGLRGAWIHRGTAATAYPASMLAPTLIAGDVVDLATRLRSGL